MNTSTSTHIASFIAALLITTTITGGMLSQFDEMAQEATAAQNAPAQVTLNTVTIVAHRG